MAKLREGIEYPIIPEDFVYLDEEPCGSIEKNSYPFDLQGCSEGINLEDWIIIEKWVRPFSEA